MKATEYLVELNTQMSYLYGFARQINELDFAASLSGEFRGMQDAGWATTITAHQVFEEFEALSRNKQPISGRVQLPESWSPVSPWAVSSLAGSRQVELHRLC